MRSAISYSVAAEWLAPKVLVSTQSTPTEKYSSWTDRTMSGRVRFRISLQPSSCWKSSSVGSCAWSIVPIAPSATTTRVARAWRSAPARARLSASADERDGFGNEAMKMLPGVRRLSALRFPWNAHPVRVARSTAIGSGRPGDGRAWRMRLRCPDGRNMWRPSISGRSTRNGSVRHCRTAAVNRPPSAEGDGGSTAMARNIQSLERAAAMLRLLAGGERQLGLSDIASSLGLAKGTAHGILRTLQQEGFVEQDDASGRYQLGAELLRLGNSY